MEKKKKDVYKSLGEFTEKKKTNYLQQLNTNTELVHGITDVPGEDPGQAHSVLVLFIHFIPSIYCFPPLEGARPGTPTI